MQQESETSCSGTLLWLRELEPNAVMPKGEVAWHDIGFVGGKNNLLIARHRHLRSLEIHVDTRRLGSTDGRTWYSIITTNFIDTCITDLITPPKTESLVVA